jgi:glycerol-3-phosphate O-acyltransferase
MLHAMRLPRPRRILARPLRLPHLVPRRTRPGDPRVFSLDAQRQDVIARVVEMVADACADEELALTLNATAHLEVRRLERQRDEEAAAALDGWRAVMRRIGHAARNEQRELLRQVVTRMTRDVAGSFDPRVYWVAQRLVPRLVAGVMKPRALVADLLGPGRDELRRIVAVRGCVDELHHLARRGTLILVPTHVSNLDSLAIGEALSAEGLPPVVYGAGKNLFSNPIVSFFMHNLGAYRVDRRIEAPLYKDVLKAYSTVMLETGHHSLFFPGGTRSRSGRVERRLKLGLVGTAHQAFARSCMRGRPQRMFVVPVTINYELVLEAETLIEDFLQERGQARYIIDDDEFSRIDRWYAFFSSLGEYEGACVLDFGPPMDPFGNPVDERGDSHAPGGRVLDPTAYVGRAGHPGIDPRRDAGYARALGRRLVDVYRRQTVVMATQLVAHVAFRRLVRHTPGVDPWGRMRRRGEVVMARDELLRDLGETRDRLAALAEAGAVAVGPGLLRAAPAEILERALAAWRYHARTPILDRGRHLVIEDPPLLLYYQNRVVELAERLASDSDRAVARELAGPGGLS